MVGGSDGWRTARMRFHMRACTLLLVLFCAGCTKRQPPPERDVATVTVTAASIASSARVVSGFPPGACWTLLDAEEPDVVRVLPDGRMLYANARSGLVLLDITHAPRAIATSHLDGIPLGVFSWSDVAFVVFVPWFAPNSSVVRAVSLAAGHEGQLVGEIRLPGHVHDARRAGRAIVVTHDLPGSGAPVTAMTSFVVDDLRGLVAVDEVRLDGETALIGGSPYGLAVVRLADVTHGSDRSSVTWISVLPEEPGRLSIRGTQAFDGSVPRWRTGSDRAIDVSEDALVRIFACATAACRQGEDASYVAVDFARSLAPHVVAVGRVARAGNAIVRFVGADAVVARELAEAHVSPMTELLFLHARTALVPYASLHVPGVVDALGSDGDDLFVFEGGRASAMGEQATVERVRLGGHPRLAGSASIGEDWPWAPAQNDPASIAIFAPSSGARRQRDPLATEEADRIAVVGDRILSFSSRGVEVRRRVTRADGVPLPPVQ